MSFRSGIPAAAAALAVAAAVQVPALPALADNVRHHQWYLDGLHMSEVRAITTGSNVTVAVVDSGVSAHRDLVKNLLSGYDEIAGLPDSHIDTDGHGTAMAGIIAATGNDPTGMVGIAPAARILPVKTPTTGAYGPGRVEKIAAGIKYAVSHKVKVINVSLGPGASPNLDQAVKDANSNDTVIVASSGNTGSILMSPLAAADGVLAVGATDRNGKLAAFSTRGPQIQICAPGVDIVSTGPNNTYSLQDGTSPATAIVSGAVALVRAKFPTLSAAEAIHRITATADDIGPPGRDDECGFGELNILKALTANVPPLTTTAIPTDAPSAAGAPSILAASPAKTNAGSSAAPSSSPTKSNGTTTFIIVLVATLAAGFIGLIFLLRRKRS